MVVMSHRVEPSELAEAAAPRGVTPFLVYAGTDGSARINHVHASIETAPEQTTAICSGFGRGVVSHVEAGGTLSLLWPPNGDEVFSLIADGTGTLDGDQLRITISAAVLHRPAPANGGPASC